MIELNEVLKTFKSGNVMQKQKVFKEVIAYFLSKYNADKITVDMYKDEEADVLRAVTWLDADVNKKMVDVVNRVYRDLLSKSMVRYKTRRIVTFSFIRKKLPVMIPITIYGKRFFILYDYEIRGSQWFPQSNVVFYDEKYGIYRRTNSMRGFNLLQIVDKALEVYHDLMKNKTDKYAVYERKINKIAVRDTVAPIYDIKNRLHPDGIVAHMEVNEKVFDIIMYRYIAEGVQYDEKSKYIRSLLHTDFKTTLNAHFLYEKVNSPLTEKEKNNLVNLFYSVNVFKKPRFKYFIADDKFLYHFITHYARSKKNAEFLLPNMINMLDKSDEKFILYLSNLMKVKKEEVIEVILKIQEEQNPTKFINFVYKQQPNINL